VTGWKQRSWTRENKQTNKQTIQRVLVVFYVGSFA
jgi:hypothetical protein